MNCWSDSCDLCIGVTSSKQQSKYNLFQASMFASVKINVEIDSIKKFIKDHKMYITDFHPNFIILYFKIQCC